MSSTAVFHNKIDEAISKKIRNKLFVILLTFFFAGVIPAAGQLNFSRELTYAFQNEFQFAVALRNYLGDDDFKLLKGHKITAKIFTTPQGELCSFSSSYHLKEPYTRIDSMGKEEFIYRLPLHNICEKYNDDDFTKFLQDNKYIFTHGMVYSEYDEEFIFRMLW
ncbi:MAG: hypothetical protein NC189_05595, partial [Bacteroides sp.]|nr:hypothetical protein [Bacteroides sp.]MCM1477403.1 hypothetical protein [Bacteroides sp.]